MSRPVYVLTYAAPHRKTYDTLCLLRAKGYDDVTVYAKPFSFVKKFKPLYEHRPEGVDISTDEVCKNFGYRYIPIESYEEINQPEGSVFLVCGAGLLPDGFTRCNKVINSHPGYVPIVRGLDSLKWAIWNDAPVGVSTHLIGDEVDAGWVIERRLIPLYEGDTFHRLAQRQYETEIKMLVDALEKIDEPHTLMPGEGVVTKRMPHDMEVRFFGKFEQYKSKHAVDAPEAMQGGGETYYVHQSSVVDSGAGIGKGTRVWHFSHVSPTAVIGEGCTLGQNVYIGSDVRVGSGCKLQNNVSVYEGVTLEDHVFCGPSCVFTNDLTPRAKYPKGRAGYKPTLVREGASIGANATIVCGHTIGRWALIGSGAVVTSDVPDHALMLGVPARRMGWVCECGDVLRGGLRCTKCGRSYMETETGLTEIKEED